jgi:hypothetical protein
MRGGRVASIGTKSIVNAAVLCQLRRRCTRWREVPERAREF